MNERINELAIQAGGIWQGGYVEQANGDSVYTDKKFVHGGDMDVEQFARLLIQECIEMSNLESAHYQAQAAEAKSKQAFDYEFNSAATCLGVGLRIKKHFGVKE